MKVLITGGAGFIGSHIAEACIERGIQTDVLDNLSNGFEHNIPRGAGFYKNNIGDDEVSSILSNGYDIIFHQAAQMNLRKSVEDPIGDFTADVLGSIKLFDAAVKNGVKHIVFASSGGAIYGEHDDLPVEESRSKNPLSPYGLNKLIIEDYLKYYHTTYSINYTCLRYANVFGPRQNHLSEAGVVSIFIERMLKNESVTINGDGRQTRDFVYVSDVVGANLKSVEEQYCGEINIGTSVETSVNEIFSLLAEKTGYEVPADYGPAKDGEQRRSALDIRWAGQAVGWKPEISLSDGLAKTVEYFKTLISKQ